MLIGQEVKFLIISMNKGVLLMKVGFGLLVNWVFDILGAFLMI